MAMISLGAWGGSGGNPWSYKPSSGVTEIVLRVRGNIKSISFTDASGLVSGTFGAEGNDRGEETKIQIKWPSEYLTSISGTYGSYGGVQVVITSLSFVTNLTTYGPFGNASGEKFSIPIADSQVVGFHGRRGHYLDALGIFVRPANSHGSISLGPWGSPGGNDPFSFRVGSWIKEIIVHQGPGVIHSLSFKDSNGFEYGKFGGKNPSDIGEEKRVEFNGHLERLTSISGSYGKHKGYVVITSLLFITNLATYGPFGTATGTSFSIPIGGSVVIGFHGRTGYWVDALGIHVKPGPDTGAISIGPWGGQGGSPWSYMTEQGIKQIVVNVGLNIKAISFRDTTGIDSGTLGGNNPDDIGEKKTVLINWPSEYLISISGTYGNFASLTTITSLSFTTNKTTYGPFGTKSGTSFSIPISNNTVVGFHGRAGHYLDAIGIFVTPKTTT